MSTRNLELLTNAAKLLKPMLDDLVFVGGCTTALLITDKAAAEVRPTYDVDAIAEITSYAQYVTFSARLRELGFREDTSEDAPICRWIHGDLKLDVMPMDEQILGFSNRWYAEAMQHAVRGNLTNDIIIRVVTAPYFLATKLEAFKGRGKSDYFASHDLEDLIAVIDGRVELSQEIQEADPVLKAYIGTEIRTLLHERQFIDALPGYLLPDKASQDRLGRLLDILQLLAAFFLTERKSNMQWEQIGPKLKEFSSKVSVIRVPEEIERRVVELVEELDKLLADPRVRPR
jgi:hypothetical protein